MRLFVKNVLQFILVISLPAILIVFTVNLWLNIKGNFVMSHKASQIVLGHSHPECAFNPEFISDFTNLGSSGESYFYTYIKTKSLLPQNPQIETVFIEFTNDQVKPYKDEWIWSDKHLGARYHTFSPFMSARDQAVLFFNNQTGFLKYLHIATKKNIKRIKNNRYDYYGKLGKFRALRDTNTVSFKEEKTIADSLHFAGKVSKYNIDYLRKLVDYLQLEGKQVYFVRSPVLRNSPFVKNEHQFQEILNSEFNGITFLDFLNFPLNNDDFFDYGHLNISGANKFSKWFNQLIESGLLEKRDKQAYIDKKIGSYQMDI